MGCYTDGKMVHFRGTEYETKICPRRHAENFRDVYLSHEVYNRTDGDLGYDFFHLSNRMAESISIIEDAIEWRREVENGD